jgi:peptide/nickel transport system permease protein
MLSEGRAYFQQSVWMAIFPGLAIMLSVMGFNFLGDGLRDALDPKMKQMLEMQGR